MDGGGRGSPLGNPKCGNFGFCDWTLGRSAFGTASSHSQDRKRAPCRRENRGKRKKEDLFRFELVQKPVRAKRERFKVRAVIIVRASWTPKGRNCC